MANIDDIGVGAAHVATIYADHYFAGGGDGYPDYLGEGQLLMEHGRRYGELLASYCDAGTLLDVGAAAGFLLQGLMCSGWRGVGLEPNAAMVAHGRDVLGLQMVQGDLETFAHDQQFDLVTMIQVVAHFHDLRRALQRAAALTKPGGLWLVESWDRSSIPARVLGKAWHEYSPPSVLHWFSLDGLTEVATQQGMRLVAHGRPQKWLNAGHAKSLLRYKLAETPLHGLFNTVAAVVPDGLAIPYPTLDLFWALYQKN